ncbi:MAG TPA: histidine phosphatase family protein [Clostridia bacterium]|nr:histidine phosphatase family protein [Clostridia bacterium]
MKPKFIILARHGESEGNADRGAHAFKPDYALALTQRGHAQAADLGRFIRDIIGAERIQFYISPWHRARETFMVWAAA